MAKRGRPDPCGPKERPGPLPGLEIKETQRKIGLSIYSGLRSHFKALQGLRFYRASVPPRREIGNAFLIDFDFSDLWKVRVKKY